MDRFSDEDIGRALQVLREGGTIIYPTDTVWGIGCDATCTSAIEKIHRVKNRQDRGNMLILLDDREKLYRYVESVPEMAFSLIGISDKPITIIYPGAKNLPRNLVGDDGSVGIRITDDEFCRELISGLGSPVVSSSANLSNLPAPRKFSEISRQIIEAVDYVVRWRQDDETPGRPSSIIKLGTGNQISIIRE